MSKPGKWSFGDNPPAPDPAHFEEVESSEDDEQPKDEQPKGQAKKSTGNK